LRVCPRSFRSADRPIHPGLRRMRGYGAVTRHRARPVR
jgi:hypothetical protein